MSEICKLNIGSSNPKGIYRDPEWVNIDIAPSGTFSGNVLCMDVFDAPADWTEKFVEIRAIHVLEHNNRNKRQDFFHVCARLLKPGGVLYIEVPDFPKTVELLHNAYKAKDEREVHIRKTSIYGKQRYPGDQHCWGFDVNELTNLAVAAKFSFVRVFKNEDKDEMISGHHRQEPILLLKAVK